MTRSVQAEVAGESETTFRRNSWRAASGLILSASICIHFLQNWIQNLVFSGSHRLILLTKKRRYDETPSKIRIPDDGDVIGKTQGQASASSAAKVMQSEMRLSLLMQDKKTLEFLNLRFSVPTWLQLMDRTTAEVTAATQRDIEATMPQLTAFAAQFKFRASLVNTDRYTANFKAERAMALEQPSFLHSHYGCDVHAAARAITKQTRAVDGHISGMVAGALAMAEAGSTTEVRECLSQVLDDRVVLSFGPIDAEHQKHLLAVLDLFVSLSTRQPESGFQWVRAKFKMPKNATNLKQSKLKQRMIIQFFLNGDIADPENVHHTTHFWGLSRDMLLAGMRKYLVPALLPHKPVMLSRKSWTGADLVFDYYGLLCSCHNLLLPVVQLFTKSHCVPEAGMGQGGQDDDLLPVADSGEPIEPDSAAAWVATKELMKARFHSWASVGPRDVLVVLRLATRPTFALMHKLLERASNAWETGQRCSFLMTNARLYNVQECAQQSLLSEYVDSMWQAFNDIPGAFAQRSCAHDVQVLHFRLLSFGLCNIEATIRTPWGAYPIKLFTLLGGNKDARRDPDCMKDDFTKALLVTRLHWALGILLVVGVGTGYCSRYNHGTCTYTFLLTFFLLILASLSHGAIYRSDRVTVDRVMPCCRT